MDRKSAAVLAVSLLSALGGIVVAAPTWSSLTTPAALGGFLLAVGGALAAAFGVKTGGAE